MNDWQPMEDAPKDGTQVLLLLKQREIECSDNNRTIPVIGVWRDSQLTNGPRTTGWAYITRTYITEHEVLAWASIPQSVKVNELPNLEKSEVVE